MDTETQTKPPSIYLARLSCRACGEQGLTEVLNLGEQHLPRFVAEPDPELPKAPLRLVQCDACGLLQLGESTKPDLLFKQFWYRTSINHTMREAMYDLVEAGLKYHGSGTWLDIGANDGYLLSQVPARFTRIAVEPAENFTAALEEHCDLVIPDYFSADHDRLRQGCEVITTAAMFYDLEDPNRFIRDIVSCLAKDGVWINQLNDAPTMLRRNAFDSICHEHVCYYDLPTLNRLYQEHGLTITRVEENQVNGGSVRVFARRQGLTTLGRWDTASPADAQAFASRVKKWRERMKDLIRGTLLYRGPLWAYGASTKGTVLLQYLDCHDAFMGVADRNQAKVGLRMAGSWLPIVSEAEFRKAKPEYVLILPWSDDFVREFLKREEDLRAQGTTFVRPLPNLELIL